MVFRAGTPRSPPGRINTFPVDIDLGRSVRKRTISAPSNSRHFLASIGTEFKMTEPENISENPPSIIINSVAA